MKYKVIKRSNPLRREEVKFYPSPINIGTLNLREISMEIAGRSSLTAGDIQSTLSNFLDELPTLLKRGHSLQLGDFGTFRLSLKGEGSVTEETFNAKTIKVHVIFTPGSLFKNSLTQIHFEHVHENNPTPPPPPAEG